MFSLDFDPGQRVFATGVWYFLFFKRENVVPLEIIPQKRDSCSQEKRPGEGEEEEEELAFQAQSARVHAVREAQARATRVGGLMYHILLLLVLLLLAGLMYHIADILLLLGNCPSP